ncbi:histone deacetylase family protein [Sneathiella sp. CAU 1612]|uniref:Histone deacetylase family protein n=1 Tax=Sneathiella sedimenti TaxID=2816034 RepID=A0ABS3F4L0_9PROT|nr:histone deacetylase family protein [Sneathiella sedimenti]MBO0333456.1 histone deacetylase family protein [Sneathiella sedimenti]
MTTYLFTHRDCLFHDTGTGHPERADRLRAVLHQLDPENFPTLVRREAPLASREQLALAHTQAHLDHLTARAPVAGIIDLDPDTKMSPGSQTAALYAAGAVVAAIDAVMETPQSSAFCAIRPPGHHAEANRAMGFCLYNNVAVGAYYARKKYGLERIAVVDFDVHHGNGTQAIFERDPGMFYASTHQAPFYPGTGDASETGVGNIVNVPLAAGSGSRAFREAYDTVILPALEAFRPELVIISAGFDGHEKDPIGNHKLTGADYSWLTKKLMVLADKHASGRVVSALEGGYDLEGLADGSHAHVKALLRD